jgi:hypothetical protein
MPQPTDRCLGGSLQARPRPAGVRRWSTHASGAVAAQARRDHRKADAKAGGHRLR